MRQLTNVISLIEDHWMILPSMIDKYKTVVEGIDGPGYAQRRADFLRNRKEGDEDFSDEHFAVQPGRRVAPTENALLYRMGVTVTEGGTAVMPIHGTLMKRPMFSLSVKLTSSDMVRDAVRQVAGMNGVRSIVLDVDSPGGSVLGIERAAQAIAEVEREMRVVAVANEMMASGGYYLAAPATEILTVESAIVGSVGVYTTRIERVQEAEMAGLKVYIVRAGEHKAEGHPFLEMSEGELARLQREVDFYYDMFVSAVERGRGISRAAALELADGTIEVGQQAVDRGFADGISSLAEAVEREDNRNNSQTRTTVMFGKKKQSADESTPMQIVAEAANEHGWTEDEVTAAAEHLFSEEDADPLSEQQVVRLVSYMVAEDAKQEAKAEAESEAMRKTQEREAELSEREKALAEAEANMALKIVRERAQSLVDSGHVLPRNSDAVLLVMEALHENAITVETEDPETGEIVETPATEVFVSVLEDQGKLVNYDEVARKEETESSVNASDGAKLIAEYAKEHDVSVSEAAAELKSKGFTFK